MCQGNRAAAATEWINSQIATLWKISSECADKQGRGIQHLKPDIAHGTCLAQFGVGRHQVKPSTHDLIFFASFTAPKLTFICNHEVLVQFHLTSGHIKHETKGPVDCFEGYTCAFRVPFRQHLITDPTYPTYGQTNACKAKFLILDLEAATFVREHSGFAHTHKLDFPEADRKQRGIVNHLRGKYLTALRESGFHFIHSLPDFDNLQRSHLIDYSAISTIEIETNIIYNINVDVINTFIKGRWLEAAGCIDELENDHDWSRSGEFALAEHRAACDDFHFHAFFGPPQIRALCSKEVIFFVDVQDLHFYLDGEFAGEAHHKFSGWRIAMIVSVHFVEEEGGSVRRLWLDFANARFCERLSCFAKTTTVIEECLLIKLRTSFTQYLSHRYVSILEEHHHHHICHLDTRVVEEEISYAEEVEFSADDYRERLCITDTFGFDIVTAITQSSINYNFRALWKASQSANSILCNWVFNHHFHASFGAPQIQLPGDSSCDTVILYLTLHEGSLTILDRFKNLIGGDKHGFSAWKLAFEVKVQLREYTKTSPVVDSCLQQHKSVGEYVKHQLVLDFTTAKFRQDLSCLTGLYDESHYLLMRSKRQALIHYITQYYFPELKKHGFHVLFTIPTWKEKSSCAITNYAQSSFRYQFYGETTAQKGGLTRGYFGRQRNSGSHNMIVICGMLDHHKRPSFPLPRCSWRWDSSLDVFCGSVVLSRSVFLDGWLLRELERINRRTTIIPDFRGIQDFGNWRFELVSLANHQWSKERHCHWRQVATHPHALEFVYRNKDKWTYEHQCDALDVHNGFYSLSCETVNNLLIPTVSKNGVCDIKLGGDITLLLEFKGAQKSWSTKSVARWDANILINNDTHGRGLKVTSSSSLHFSDGSGFDGDCDIVHPLVKDAATLLKEQLRDVSIIENSTIKALELSFSSVWPLLFSCAHGYTLRNPVFNSCGDILFDLESPLDVHGQVTVSNSRPDITVPSKKPISRPSLLSLGKITESARHFFSETSLKSSSTAGDSPLKTPPEAHSTLHGQPKVTVRSVPDFSDEEDDDHEALNGHSFEKSNRSFDIERAGVLMENQLFAGYIPGLSLWINHLTYRDLWLAIEVGGFNDKSTTM